MAATRRTIKALLLLPLVLCVVALAATETQFPASGVSDPSNGGTVAWTGPGNAVADDGLGAVATMGAGATSEYLVVTDFGFSIPSGATINGIEVTIERFRQLSGTLQDSSLRLIVGGAASGDNKADATNWPGAMTAKTYGGATDTWGLTPSAADVNASGFGVTFAAAEVGGVATGRANLDYISMTVHYTEGSTGISSAQTMLIGGN
jgi:hypothetical protein